MKIIDKTYSLPCENIIKLVSFFPDLPCGCNLSDILFLDIETTGLRASESEVYLIGCMHYSMADQLFHIRQFYCNTFADELTMLRTFIHYIEPFSAMISLYGNRFEFAYLKECLTEYHLNTEHFDQMIRVDLFHLFSPYKSFFGLTDLKRQSIEQLLSLSRSDHYTGAHLVDLRLKSTESGEASSISTILLHNEEDLTTLLPIMQLMAFALLEDAFPSSLSFSFVNPQIISQAEDHMHLTTLVHTIEASLSGETSDQYYPLYGILKATFPFDVPVSYSFSAKGFCFSLSKNQLTILSAVFYGVRRLYFHDIRSYFYLPGEDRAIHKSLAGAVPADQRVKATQETCYDKESDYYLITTYLSKKYPNTPYDFGPVFANHYEDFLGCMRVRDIEDHEDIFAAYYLKSTLWSLLHEDHP